MQIRFSLILLLLVTACYCKAEQLPVEVELNSGEVVQATLSFNTTDRTLRKVLMNVINHFTGHLLSLPHGKLFMDNDLVDPGDATLSFSFTNEKGKIVNKKITVTSPMLLENIFEVISSPKRLIGSKVLEVDAFRFHINEKPFSSEMRTFRNGIQGVEGVYTDPETKTTERIDIVRNGIPYTADWFSKVENILERKPYRVSSADKGSYEAVQVLGTEGPYAIVAAVDDLIAAQKDKQTQIRIFRVPKEKIDIVDANPKMDTPANIHAESILGEPYLRLKVVGKTPQAQYDSIHNQVFPKVESAQDEKPYPGFLQRCREFLKRMSTGATRSIENRIEIDMRVLESF